MRRFNFHIRKVGLFVVDHIEWFLAFGVSVFFLGLYSQTQARLWVHYADSLDLILAGVFQGRAHPPGYALLTIPLGWVWTWSNESIVSVQMFNSLLQALANGLLVLVVVDMAKMVDKVEHKKQRLVAGLVAGVIWGISAQVWIHANVVEVFAMANLLLVSFLLLLIKSMQTDNRLLLAGLGIIAGLGIGFHSLTSLIIVPSMLFWVWVRKGSRSYTTKSLLTVIVFALIMFAAEVFLLPSFVTGTRYSWLIDWNVTLAWQHYWRSSYLEGGSAVETYTNDWNVSHSLHSLIGLIQVIWTHFGVMVILLALTGWWWLRQVDRKWFLWLMLLTVLTGPVLIWYMKFPDRNISYDLEYFWVMLFVFECFLD